MGLREVVWIDGNWPLLEVVGFFGEGEKVLGHLFGFRSSVDSGVQLSRLQSLSMIKRPTISFVIISGRLRVLFIRHFELCRKDQYE